MSAFRPAVCAGLRCRPRPADVSGAPPQIQVEAKADIVTRHAGQGGMYRRSVRQRSVVRFTQQPQTSAPEGRSGNPETSSFATEPGRLESRTVTAGSVAVLNRPRVSQAYAR